jgi:hypothetical protein
MLEIGEWLTRQEAADRLGVSPNYINRLTDMGCLVPLYLGSRSRGGVRLYHIYEVDAYRRRHPNLGLRRKTREDDSCLAPA